MLNGLRKAGQSVVGKIVATVLFSILILSFAIWGIGDIFRTPTQTVVAEVGSTDISVDQYRTAYNRELQRLSRQFRTNISTEQARTFGIDQNVLSRLVTEAVLDERARKLGVAISDQLVARTVVEDPTFQGPGGQFDRNRFEQLLRDNNLNEPLYVHEQRAAIARTQLAEALTGDLPVPLAAREAIHRFATEKRAASYLVLPASAAGDIPAPTEEQVQAFFNERKGSFQAPEYRAITVMTLDPSTLAKPDEVSDADARQRYEQEKARFGTPERRTVQQISFPTKEEAEAAFNRIKEGATFEQIASERNLTPQDTDIGTFSKSEMVDPAVADAAFALQEGATSGPVESRFGPVLVRVSKVEPAAVRPFEEVAGEIRAEIANQKARDAIEDVHDAIEDLRASARPLAEIAKEKNLPLMQVPAVSREGRDKAGKPVENLPDRDAVLAAVYASDIGVDNEPVRGKDGGYVWFEITGIEPARDQTLAEVRPEVERQWRQEQVSDRLSEKARGLVERLNKDEPIETLAAEVGLQVETATELDRNAPKGNLTADVVRRIFTTPVGKAESAAGSPDTRTVFKVTSATVPPFLTTTQQAQQIETQLRQGMSDDILAQYIAQAQKEMNVRIYPETVRQVVGGGF
jgi:peptidyl-prolyl cis-trans isomerase D